MQNENRKMNSGTRLSWDYSYTYIILTEIIPYLDYKDLISCSKVCTIWNNIIREAGVWTNFEMTCCGFHLDRILEKDVLFFKKIYMNEVRAIDGINYVNVLNSVDDLQELTIVRCYFNFTDKVTNLDTLKVLKISQSLALDTLDNPYTEKVFSNLPNLQELSITTRHCICLDHLEHLKQLKHLFLDANYRNGFFGTSHGFLKNLQSFGVGFSNYENSPEDINQFNAQLSMVLKELSGMTKFLLYGSKNFEILRTVSQLSHLEKLELGLMRAWNYYSPYLKLCTNVKDITVKVILEPRTFIDVEEVAAHNSILYKTIGELRTSLKQFTWIFDKYYMKESDRRRNNLTVIWKSLAHPLPENLNRRDLQRLVKLMSIRELPVAKLEEMLRKDLPDTKVQLVAEAFKRCEFCPEHSSEVSVNMDRVRMISSDTSNQILQRILTQIRTD